MGEMFFVTGQIATIYLLLRRTLVLVVNLFSKMHGAK